MIQLDLVIDILECDLLNYVFNFGCKFVFSDYSSGGSETTPASCDFATL